MWDVSLLLLLLRPTYFVHILPSSVETAGPNCSVSCFAAPAEPLPLLELGISSCHGNPPYLRYRQTHRDCDVHYYTTRNSVVQH
ncbi:hypothetical protein F5B17DRAFT_124846 [Nemania serpens]|nr:hypothetical protein F5B17DRAFT_124846 [Nemania serpens]